MPQRRRKPSKTERDERRRRDRERLVEATRALLSSQGWRAWLRARATLHSYSLQNTLLIAQQAHRRGFTPSHVAGFRAWLKLGRAVRKGEHGLAIYAPMRIRERDEDGEQSDDSRVVFRLVHVFDVSQTEPLPGIEPAPLAPPRAPLEGDSHAQLLEPLERLAAELGYTVGYRPLAGAEGLCDHRQRCIAVDQGLAANARVATLVHELGHALIQRQLDGRPGLAKPLEELVVEATAYVALAGAGLQTDCDSVPYIAGWSGDDALEQLQRAAELIDALARGIEQAIGAHERADQAVAPGGRG